MLNLNKSFFEVTHFSFPFLFQWVCSLSMGDFEVFANYDTTVMLGIIIYSIINSLGFRNLIRRFGITRVARKDFYECGFRPQKQEPIRLPLQFLLICIFFLLYDIELVFLFPFVSDVLNLGFYDFGLMIFFFLVFGVSMLFDYERHALYWQY